MSRQAALFVELELVPHQGEYWLPNYRPLTEVECREMAAGRVPEWLAAVCLSMVEWTLQTGPLDYVGRRQTQQRHGGGAPPRSGKKRMAKAQLKSESA